MKVLSISRGGLEIARVHLHRSMATIGRSPVCDVVLRAPEVEPVHFVLEWVGVGSFDPKSGDWSIFDISSAADISGEGVLLKDSSQQFGSFKFEWVEDSLEQEPEIGGAIRAALRREAADPDNKTVSRMLELIHVRSDSGALEEVLHLKPKPGKKVRPLRAIREFRVLLNRQERADALEVLLSEMPGAEVYRRGVLIREKKIELSADDLLKVIWKGHLFFLRFVPEIRVPTPLRSAMPRDRLFLGLSLAAALMGFFLLGVIPFLFAPPEEEKPDAPPRIATVEIKVAPPIPEPQSEPVEALKEETAEKHEQVVEAPVKVAVKNKTPAQAAAARQPPKPSAVEKSGLNSPAQVTDVNRVGLLGALNAKSGGPKGPGIEADRILNQGIITESVSADTGKIVLKTPPPAILGNGKTGVTKPDESVLAKAATTLQGGKGYDPKAIGNIGAANATRGYKTGNSLGGDGSGLAPGWEFGKLDTRSFSVAGGLDRETVRRVIAQHRNQIRACYEKALLANPQLAGRVSYRWLISPAGPVTSVQITKSNTSSAQLESCVLDVIKQMNFPAARNGQPTTVIYPFVFQART